MSSEELRSGNHSNGNVVHFQTEQSGTLFQALTEQRAGWRKTWLHSWLIKHAATYRFNPLVTEEWHWDYV